MIRDRNVASNASIFPGKIAGMGIGEVFYVCKNTDANDKLNYGWLSARVPGDRLFTTIAAALAETQECRNDYVIVWPSNADYDITAALVMDKKSVHLICPAGFGNERGSTNAVRIHQTTAATAVIAVSDASIEIAGFYLKNYQNVSHITLAATSYAPNIHHNTFTMNTSSTTSEPCIACSGDAGGWGTVAEYNWFCSYAGNDTTIASVITVGASATCARVCHNDFSFGDGITVTVGINNQAVKGTTNYNNFSAAGGDSTITHAISVHTQGSAIGNRVCGTVDGEVMTGGTVDYSFCDNMNALNGGVVDDND